MEDPMLSVAEMARQDALQYSLPGVIAFLQEEHRRYNREKLAWSQERAAMESRLAALEGEKKGMENLRKDLLRRVKMLEYALRQERAKYAALEQGKPYDPASVSKIGASVLKPLDKSSTRLSPIPRKRRMPRERKNTRSRIILRQYLDEIGYLEADKLLPKAAEEASRRHPAAHQRVVPAAQDLFKISEEDQAMEKALKAEEEALIAAQKETEELEAKEKLEKQQKALEEGEGDDEALKEVLTKKLHVSSKQMEKMMKAAEGSKAGKRKKGKKTKKYSKMSAKDLKKMGEKGAMKEFEDTNVPEGQDGGGDEELAGMGISVSKEGKVSAIASSSDGHRKWKPKFTLRSHMDGVRMIDFHATEPVLVSASEDATIKVWNLNATSGKKKSRDIEPIRTLRGHTGPVFAAKMDSARNLCVSGGQDATVRLWKLPDFQTTAYEEDCQAEELRLLEGHTDAVWDIALHPVNEWIASASSDGTVRVWDPSQVSTPLVFTLRHVRGHTPTSVTFVPTDLKKLAVGYNSGALVVFDLEKGEQQFEFKGDAHEGGEPNPTVQINRVVAHPSLPILFTAHEDHRVCAWDITTESQVSAMTAHEKAVSSLAMDAAGLYFATAGHDMSLRWWNVSDKSCIQVSNAHRLKFDEAIHTVGYHATLSYFGSGGADGTIKIYV